MDKKVDFIGVGMPRAATTWIGECLAEHPDIRFSSQFFRKEIKFFSDPLYKKGIEWYLNLFPDVGKNTIIGEYSPTYFWDDKAAKRIKKHFPEVKLIISLRNPVDMIYSYYWKDDVAIRERRPDDFDQAVKENLEKDLKLDHALYARRLENFLNLFPRENILIIVYDNIVNEPKKVIENMYKFLGVESKFKPKILARKINTTKKTKSEALKKLFSLVYEIFKYTGLNKVANRLVSEYNLYKIYDRVNKFPWNYPPMKKETLKKLVNYYQDDILKAEELTSRDLSKWLEI